MKTGAFASVQMQHGSEGALLAEVYWVGEELVEEREPELRVGQPHENKAEDEEQQAREEVVLVREEGSHARQGEMNTNVVKRYSPIWYKGIRVVQQRLIARNHDHL